MMPTPVSSTPASTAAEDRFAAALSKGAGAREGAVARLCEALEGSGPAAIDQRVLAQIAAQVADLERQAAAFDDIEAATARLRRGSNLVAHLHARAIEFAQLEHLAETVSIDAVLPPLLQAASADPAWRDLITAQARFIQDQRRGEIEWTELPADVGPAARSGQEAALASRIDLLGRFVAEAGSAAGLLDPEQAGFSLFASALAARTGLARDAIVAATIEPGMPRIVLALLACGVSGAGVGRRLSALARDPALVEQAPALDPEAAARLLARSQ